MGRNTWEQRAKQGQTPPGEIHSAGAAKHLALGALCLLGLSAACSSSPDYGDDKNALRGVRTVSFDKNGGDTEAVPESMTLRPPATTVERLPEPPTRAGRTFAGWNTEKDGSGSPFTEQTPVTADILLIVYARWELPTQLELRLPRDTLHFTPMKDGTYDERSPVLAVTVSGFKNKADADKVRLEVSTPQGNDPPWFEWRQEADFSEGTQTFVLHFAFLSTGFAEWSATLSLQLKDIPAGYEYGGGAHTLRVVAAHGQDENRPIPVHQGNIEHFNRYADTNEGLKLHYQLVENVVLTPPEAGKSNWKAIGTFSDTHADNRPFTGSFDGGGYSISGLTIVSPDDDFQGMFSLISPGAEIKNLGLEGGSVTSRDYVGSLVGWNEGTVHKSYATGSVTCRDFVGGLLGWNGGTVQHSYATGNVMSDNFVGGLVGYNFDTVQNSYATGSVTGNDGIGGLVGLNGGPVQNSYATGSVEGRGGIVGGLVGWNLGGRVHNSVALNPSVIAAIAKVGRVAGLDGLLSDNYARNNMKLESGGKPYEPTEDTAQADKKDGAGTSAFNTRDFWTSTLSSWDFSEDSEWAWKEGFLPILRNVGGEQEPRVQEVP